LLIEADVIVPAVAIDALNEMPRALVSIVPLIAKYFVSLLLLLRAAEFAKFLVADNPA